MGLFPFYFFSAKESQETDYVMILYYDCDMRERVEMYERNIKNNDTVIDGFYCLLSYKPFSSLNC